MFYSLIIKLGMFAATMGVVFWIGWSQPTSSDLGRDPAAESVEEPKADIVSGSERVSTVNPSPVALLPEHPPTTVSKRSQPGLLDLNRATEQDLDALPGVGAKLAARIMKYRQSVGVFRSLDELRAVKGIGKKKFEQIRLLVTVAPDAKSAGRGKKAT
jgi:competence protein ComEA